MTKSTALSNLRWSSIPKALVHSPVPAKVGGKRALCRDVTLDELVVRRDVRSGTTRAVQSTAVYIATLWNYSTLQHVVSAMSLTPEQRAQLKTRILDEIAKKRM